LFSIIQAAGWPIWPLIFCSVLGLALVIERFVSLKTSKVCAPQVLDEAIMVSRNGVPGTDVVDPAGTELGVRRGAGQRLSHLHNNPKASEDDLRSAWKGPAAWPAAKLQRYLGALATIASAAPLLGLLGTVIGMIEIFGSQGGDGGMGTVPGGGNPASWRTAFRLRCTTPPSA
jgi:biopolymer transport protein ExbB